MISGLVFRRAHADFGKKAVQFLRCSAFEANLPPDVVIAP